MPALDLTGVNKDGRPRKILMNATPGKIRVVQLPAGPVRVQIGPGMDAAGTTISGTMAYQVGIIGSLTDGASQVAVADNAIRSDLGTGDSESILLTSGQYELGISSSVASGYVQLIIQPHMGV